MPIHVACKYNNWRALAILIQKRLYDKHGQDINLPTINGKNKTDTHTALSLSVAKGHNKCVQILCEDKNIYIDDMSFYNSIQSNKSEILKYLLKATLNKDSVYDWKSFEQNKNITIEFLTQLMEFGNNNCTAFLRKLIDHGIKKKDYVNIALLLNYNISSLKVNDKSVPNITIQVNTYDNDNDNSNDASERSEESKQDIIGPWIVKQKIGEGAFGQVKLGVNQKTKEKVALKFISTVNIPRQFVLGEIACVQKIDDSNVIVLKGFNLNVYGDGKNVLIAFEYAQYGELFDLLKYSNYFSINWIVILLFYTNCICNSSMSWYEYNSS